MTTAGDHAEKRSGRDRGRRSFVDPVSNITLLSPVELDVHLGNLVNLELPPSCLASFLHEATHHWSFFSPVGTALSCLALRARRRAVVAASRGNPTHDDVWDVIDDLVRYRAGSEALRPLSEGLALFAEFDDLPTTSRVASDVMWSAAALFLAGSAVDPDEPLLGRPLVEMLDSVRARPEVWERKANLLMQPLRVSPVDGYLPGYLVAKALWLESWRLSPRLSDSDLMLNYLYTYLFGDYGLVAHLLEPHASDVSARDLILGYVMERFQRLTGAEHERNLDLLEQAADLPHQTSYGEQQAAMPNLATDPELWRLGEQRLEAMFREIRETSESADRLERALAERDLWALGQRELLTIGREAVTVRTGENGWVSVWKDGRLVQSGPGVDPETPAGSEEGTLEAFVNPWRWGRYVAITVSVGDRLACSWLSRELDDDARRQFDGYRKNLDLLEKENRVLADVVDEVIGDDHIVLDIVAESSDDELDRIYTQVALGFVPEKMREARRSEMREDGFYAILGKVSLVRVLAWLSVVSRLGEDRAALAEQFDSVRDYHRAEGDFETVLESLRGMAMEKLGDPLVYDNGDGLFSCV